jgi:hypothetical protein
MENMRIVNLCLSHLPLPLILDVVVGIWFEKYSFARCLGLGMMVAAAMVVVVGQKYEKN